MADDLTVPPPPPDEGVPVLSPFDEPPPPPAPRPPDYSVGAMAVLLAVAAGYGVILFAAWFVGGEVVPFAVSGLEALPFLPLALLAYAGECNGRFRVIAIAYWLLLVGAAGVTSWLITTGAVVDPKALEALKDPAPGAARPTPEQLFLPGGLAQSGVVLLGLLLAFAVCLVSFSRTARESAARYLDF